MIDQDTINRIFDTADIVEVISDFVQLKKSGSNYKGLSPFSNEKTPSFMVSPSKGIYKDFSSGKGGNVVGFLMEHERLSYPEALKYLAKKYNIEIREKEKTAEDILQENVRESLLVVSSFAAKYFREKLKNSDDGRAIAYKYLIERGLRDQVIEKFELGYNPDSSGAFTDWALKSGYKKEYLVKSGLSSESNEHLFDRFRGRIIFPIHGLSGTVIGFGARTLRSDKSVAKYLNSPESEIYHKSRILYGLYFARKAVVAEDKCYLVEGYTDVLAMHQAGIENVVASSGTALTIEQIRLIKRFTTNIHVIYDGDEAGMRASFRGIDLILEEGLNVKVVPLPEGEDPDSFSGKKGSGEFREYLDKNEKDFITFKTSVLLKEADSDPVKRANLVTELVRSISVIPEGIVRSVYIRECSTLLNVDERLLYSEVNKRRKAELEQKWKRGKSQVSQAPVQMPTQPLVPSFVEEVYSEHEEREIIYFLLKFGNKILRIKEGKDEEEITVAGFILREIRNDELEFQNLLYKKVFEDVAAALDRGEPMPDDKYFIYHEEKSVQDLAVEIYSSRYELSKVWKRKDTFIELPGENLGSEVPKAMLAYKNRIIVNAIRNTEKSLQIAFEKGDMQEVTGIQRRYMDLKQVQKSIAHRLGERTIISY